MRKTITPPHGALAPTLAGLVDGVPPIGRGRHAGASRNRPKQQVSRRMLSTIYPGLELTA
jgi:hypothetical protein